MKLYAFIYMCVRVFANFVIYDRCIKLQRAWRFLSLLGIGWLCPVIANILVISYADSKNGASICPRLRSASHRAATRWLFSEGDYNAHQREL